MLEMLTTVAPLADAWHDDDGPGWWIAVFPLFWIALIATAVVLLRRWRPWAATAQPPAAAPRESALDVLERRFAEGELSEEEYRARRTVLTEERGEG